MSRRETNQKIDQKVKELEDLLKKCNDFILNTQKDWEKELKECQKDYDRSCKDLENAKKDYEKDLAEAKKENYTKAQMETMTNFHMQEIKHCEKYKEEMEGFLKKAQEDVDRLPELLDQAKSDKERIEIQLSVLKQQQSSPVKWIVNIGFWAIVILLIFKACS